MRFKILLILIFILGASLRFYGLGEVPVGLHRDEAFLGYNAYSIMQTGRDMNGNFLPLHLESFLYSPAGYSYFSIPFIKLFDLNTFSVRFASAFFGSLTILITYFLTKIIFSNSPYPPPRNPPDHLGGVAKRLPRGESWSEAIALSSAFFLAISPWHINLSRTATENIVVVFFISLGVLLYLLWARKNSWPLLITAFLSFGITLFIYQAPRAFLPLFIPLMFFLLVKDRFNLKKNLHLIILFLTIIVLPLLFIFTSKELSLRIRTVSVFSTQETQLVVDEQLREDGISNIMPPVARVFHNKLIGYWGQFVQNYFAHFSFDFLFGDQGLPIRYKVPNMGLLYLFELPLLLIGIWILLRKARKEGGFLLGWVLLVPIGSALTFDDVPNLQRTLLVFPALSIIIATGLLEALNFIRKQRFFYPVLILIIFIILYNFIFYLHQYYIHQLVHRPWYRHEGYKELVAKVNALLSSYERAVITNRESAPTIFFLFYGKYNPARFQEETKNSVLRDFDRVGFGKYEFSEEECPLKEFEDVDKTTGEVQIVNSGEKDVLYVNYGVCKVSEKTARLIDTIKRRDQTAVFQILEVKE